MKSMIRRSASCRALPGIAVLLLAATVIAGCRGMESGKPPIHPNPNMDTQEKYKPQSESRFFADGSTMRTPPANAVRQGGLREDPVFYTGKTGAGQYSDSPIEIKQEIIARGRERYGIFCRPCHGDLGNGRGKIMDYKYPIPPTSYFEPRILEAKDGYIFEVISQGIRNMSGYKAQVPTMDRWCITAHVRELQKASLPDSQKGLLPQPAANTK